MDQNGLFDHFGQKDLIPNRILVFARPKWTKMVHFGPSWPEEAHFGPLRSVNHTLAMPERLLSKSNRCSINFSAACVYVSDRHSLTLEDRIKDIEVLLLFW